MIDQLISLWINSSSKKLWRSICSFNGGTVCNRLKFAGSKPKILGKSGIRCRWILLQAKTQMLPLRLARYNGQYIERIPVGVWIRVNEGNTDSTVEWWWWWRQQWAPFFWKCSTWCLLVNFPCKQNDKDAMCTHLRGFPCARQIWCLLQTKSVRFLDSDRWLHLHLCVHCFSGMDAIFMMSHIMSL